MVKPQQIILALTNPVPEITEEQALKAGAAFYSDGLYVNNLLAYPGIFKGALETRATGINDSMLLAAVQAIVKVPPSRRNCSHPSGSHGSSGRHQGSGQGCHVECYSAKRFG